ncbi:MAG TPA: hypothetical protein P5291_11395 [Flavobacteriales bacterium]|nr:hypothetical protein [Flavobacteriales bacterium]
MVNVTIDTWELSIATPKPDDLINTIPYAAIDTIYPITSVQLYRDAPVLMQSPEATERVEQFYAVILLRDGRNERIQLGAVDNQAGWTNDRDGFVACANDIYTAMGG